MKRQTRFTPTFIYLLSAMIVWTTFFMGSYGMVAAICAFRLPEAWLGISTAQLGLGVATLIALTVTSLLAVRAWRYTAGRRGGYGGFAASLVILQSIVALVAITWNFLPLAFLDGCGLQELGNI